MVEQQGGKRIGAGRPRNGSEVRSDAIVAKKMRTLAEQGYEVLVENYVSLMRTAIAVAIGSEKAGPNPSMLKTLLELVPKVLPPEGTDEDSPILKLVGEIRAEFTESSGTKSRVESDTGKSDIASNGGDSAGNDADAGISGVDGRVSG